MISACCGKLLVVLREFYAHFQTSPCSKRAPVSAERHMKWTQKLHFLSFNSLNTTFIMRSWKNSSVFKSILPTLTNMVLLKESSLHLILKHCGLCSKQFSFWNFTFSFLGWMSVYFPSTTFLSMGELRLLHSYEKCLEQESYDTHTLHCIVSTWCHIFGDYIIALAISEWVFKKGFYWNIC